MIKDVLVNLPVGEARDTVSGYAVSIARTFNAHLAGVAFNYDPILPDAFVDGMAAGFIDAQRAESDRAAREAIAKFNAATQQAGISAASQIIEASFGGAAGRFGEIARRFDLSVVGQKESAKTAVEELLIEAALFESGRPVVIVPYIQKDPLKLERVLVCWDRSRNAARAIADAMPFLERAKGIDLLTISSKDVRRDEPQGADIADHLIRHGLKVDIRRIVSSDADIASTILSFAADSVTDFVVMGGYGHSRLREFILGGATRGILGAMTVPTLMSH
jgi:nucleotide-binding universal stress UspA family protein